MLSWKDSPIVGSTALYAEGPELQNWRQGAEHKEARMYLFSLPLTGCDGTSCFPVTVDYNLEFTETSPFSHKLLFLRVFHHSDRTETDNHLPAETSLGLCSAHLFRLWSPWLRPPQRSAECHDSQFYLKMASSPSPSPTGRGASRALVGKVERGQTRTPEPLWESSELAAAGAVL